MVESRQTEGKMEKERQRKTGREEEALKDKKKLGGWRGFCNYTTVCSEVNEINWRLMGEYGFTNDKSIGDNVSIVL